MGRGSESPRGAGVCLHRLGTCVSKILDRTSRCLGIWEHFLVRHFSTRLEVSGERQVSEVHKEEMFNHPRGRENKAAPGSTGEDWGTSVAVWPGHNGPCLGARPPARCVGTLLSAQNQPIVRGETSQEVTRWGPRSQSTAGPDSPSILRCPDRLGTAHPA